MFSKKEIISGESNRGWQSRVFICLVTLIVLIVPVLFIQGQAHAYCTVDESPAGDEGISASIPTLTPGANNGLSGSFDYVVNHSNSYYIRIWIDFNQDSDFDDSGELVFSQSMSLSGSGSDIFSDTFYVPSGAASGSTKTRSVIAEGSAVSSCGDVSSIGGDYDDGSVTIEAPNIAPVISPGSSVSVTMDEDGSPTAWNPPPISATDADGDLLTWSKLSGPSHGTADVSGTGSSPSTLNYIPTANYYGNDSFVVKVFDGTDPDTITVNVTINPVNDAAPVINAPPPLPGPVVMDEDGSPVAFSLILSATDVDSDTLTWSISVAASHGTAGADPGTGNITYTPNTDYNNDGVTTDSFTVSVKDASAVPDLGDDQITVNVTVTPRNDPPVNTAPPTFAGVMFTEETVSKTGDGTWNDLKDAGTWNIAPIGYQWQRADNNSGANLADIPGETATDYDLTPADVGKYIRLKVTVEDDGVGLPATQTAEAFSEYRGVPKIATDAETSVNTTDATFNGTLSSLGEAISDIRFEYGTTASYGSVIAASPASVAAEIHTDTAVSATVPTLGAGIVYHYRAAAKVGGFDIYGTDQTFVSPTSEMDAPGNALSFNGSNYVTTAGVMTAGTDNISIEAWVYWSGGQFAVYNGDIANDGYGIMASNPANSGNISIFCGGAAGTADADIQLTPNRWEHIAAVRSGGTWHLYINGAEEPLTGNPSPITPTGSASIGSAGGTQNFSGMIDELRVWNTALSAAAIRDNMCRALTGGEGSLAAYYHFDHAAGTVLADRTANHNDGTLVNGPSWTDSAAFTAWTAGVSGDWNTGTNWSDGAPGAGSSVGIPSGGAPDISGTAACHNLIIGSGGSLTAGSGASLTVSGNCFNQGTFSGAADSTAAYSGSSHQTVMAGTYGNLTVNNINGITPAGTMTINGTLTMTSGAISPAGYVTYGAGGTLKYNGSSPQTTGDAEFPASGGPTNITVANGTGVTLHADRTLTGTLDLTGKLSAGEYSLSIGGDMTMNSGELSATAGNITVGGDFTQNGGTFSGGDGTADIGGSLTIAAGGFTAPSGTLSLAGDWINTGGTFAHGNGTVIFDGASDQALQSGGGTFFNLTINKGGTLTLADILDTDGDLTISAGTLNTGDQNIFVGGDWSSSGAFVSGTETVTLDGADQKISGSNTFNNLTKTSGNLLTFQNGAIQTVTDTVTLRGASASSRLLLRSDAPGARWLIDPQGTYIFGYLDVSDSENIAVPKIDIVTTGSKASGNNVNWNIEIPAAAAQSIEGTEDTPVSVTLSGSDGDGDPLTFKAASLPAHGTLWVTYNGWSKSAQITAPGDEIPSRTVLYEPSPDGNGGGYGNFSFTVNDGDYDAPAALITVNIAPVNDAPVITGQTAVFTPEDIPLEILLSHLTVTDVDNAYPADFTLTVHPANNYLMDGGNVIRPAPDLNGTIIVPVTVNDGLADSSRFEITVTVGAVDDPPVPSVPIGDIQLTDGDTEAAIPLSEMFSDVDNDSSLIAFAVQSSDPSLVSAVINGDVLNLTYAEDRIGEAVITLTATSNGKTVTQTFTVTVNPQTFAVSGQTPYYSNGQPVPGTLLTLKGTNFYTGEEEIFTAETFSDGTYVIKDAVRGEYTLTPSRTDDPGTAGLSSDDASKIAGFALRRHTLTEAEIRLADVTGNGTVSATDASRLGRYVGGLVPAMNYTREYWRFEPASLEISLNADAENQDFTVTRIGDMSGNWTPGKKRSIRDAAHLTKITAEPGEVLSVPVIFSEPAEIRGVDIAAEFDGSVLKPGEITLAGGILEYGQYELIVNTNEPGRIRIVLFAPAVYAFTGTGTFLTLNFDVTGSRGSGTLLTLTQFDCNEIPVSDETAAYRDAESAAGGFYMNGEVSHALGIGIGTEYQPAVYDPAVYDVNGDGRTDVSDAVFALREGNPAAVIRVLQHLTGIPNQGISK